MSVLQDRKSGGDVAPDTRIAEGLIRSASPPPAVIGITMNVDSIKDAAARHFAIGREHGPDIVRYWPARPWQESRRRTETPGIREWEDGVR